MFKSKKFWVLLLALASLGLGYATLAMTPPFGWFFALLATLTVLCALLRNNSAFTCVPMVAMPLFAVASVKSALTDDVYAAPHRTGLQSAGPWHSAACT